MARLSKVEFSRQVRKVAELIVEGKLSSLEIQLELDLKARDFAMAFMEGRKRGLFAKDITLPEAYFLDEASFGAAVADAFGVGVHSIVAIDEVDHENGTVLISVRRAAEKVERDA